MKTIYRSIIVITIVIICSTSFAQERKVYWVHGLKGCANMYIDLANYFNQQRLITSTLPNYNTDGGIRGSADTLKNKWMSVSYPNAICIAQSMGGLNVKKLYKDNISLQPFGGLITTGTPHIGAKIANNIDNGKLIEFINTIHKKMIDCIAHDPWNLIIYSTIAGEIIDAIEIPSGFIIANWKGLLFNFSGLINNYLNTTFFGSEITKSDLKENSSMVNELKNYTLPIPQIAIYGVENHPATLRNIGTRIKSKKSNYIPCLGQLDNDYQIVEKIASVKDIMHGVSTTYYANAIIRFWFGAWTATGRYAVAGKCWRSAANFLDGPFQKGLDHVMGYTITVNQPYSHWIYTCSINPTDPTMPEQKNLKDAVPPVVPFDPNDPCWHYVTIQVPVIVPTESDGVVKKESAMALTGVGNAQYQVLGVNHEQLKNSTTIKNIFQEIFNGDKRDKMNSPFFIVNNRN